MSTFRRYNIEVIKNILQLIMPIEVSSLYMQLIKLIELYSLKCYYLDIERQLQLELLTVSKQYSLVNLDELKKKLQKNMFKIINFEAGKISEDLRELSQEGEFLRRKISDVESFREKFCCSEENIMVIAKDIRDILDMIKLKLEEIKDRRINDLSVIVDYVDIVNNIVGLSSYERSALMRVIGIHLEMWKAAFEKVEIISESIIEAYSNKELINVDEMNFPIIYACTRLCNHESGYDVLLNLILNEQNSIVVQKVTDFLTTGLISEDFINQFEDVDGVDRHYLWMYSLMRKTNSGDFKTPKKYQRINSIDDKKLFVVD